MLLPVCCDSCVAEFSPEARQGVVSHSLVWLMWARSCIHTIWIPDTQRHRKLQPGKETLPQIACKGRSKSRSCASLRTYVQSPASYDWRIMSTPNPSSGHLARSTCPPSGTDSGSKHRWGTSSVLTIVVLCSFVGWPRSLIHGDASTV